MAIGTYIKSTIKENLMAILIVLGIIIGVMLGFTMSELKHGPYTTRECMYVGFLGEILMNMLSAITPPLTIASLVISISNLDTYISPRMGGQLLVYFVITKFLSTALGIGVAILMCPGYNIHIIKEDNCYTGKIQDITLLDTILDLFRNMFPQSMVELNFLSFETILIRPNNSKINKYEWDLKEEGVMANSINMIGIISWSILLGTALSLMPKRNLPLLNFFHCLAKITMVITVWVLWLSPVMIIFVLINEILEMGGHTHIIPIIGNYVLVLHVGYLIQFVLVYPLIYFICVRKNPFVLYKSYWDALVVAFGTGSSVSVIPISIKCLIEKTQIDPRVVWFIIPVSHCLNMDGLGIFMGVASVFIAQVHEITVSWGNVIAIIVLGSMGSFICASSPNRLVASFAMVLEGVGYPRKEIGILFVVEFLIYHCMAVINILGDAIAVGVIASYNESWLELGRSDTELRNMENEMFDSSYIPNTYARENDSPNGTVTPRETVTQNEGGSSRGASSRMKSALPRRARGPLVTDNLKESDEL